MKYVFFILCALTPFLGACSSGKVIVKKDTCVDIFGGVLMECDQVKKEDTK